MARLAGYGGQVFIATAAQAGIRAWQVDHVLDTPEVTDFASGGHKQFIAALDGWSGTFEGPKDGPPIDLGSVAVANFDEHAQAVDLFENCISGDDGADAIIQPECYAQTFTPVTSYQAGSCKLKLYRVGNPSTVTVSIRATAAGLPTGANLCSGTTNGDTLTTDSGGEWRTISMGAGYPLVAGTQYARVVRALLSDITNYILWRRAVFGSYAGGSKCFSPDNGATWSIPFPGHDMMFEEWGQVYPSLTRKWQGAIILTARHAKVTADGLVEYSYDFVGNGALVEVPTT